MTLIPGELILIRHGKAELLEESTEDAQRKLTKTGIEDLKKILPELKRHFITAKELQIYLSPKLRSVAITRLPLI